MKKLLFRGGEWRWRKTHVKRDTVRDDSLFAINRSFIIMSFTSKNGTRDENIKEANYNCTTKCSGTSSRFIFHCDMWSACGEIFPVPSPSRNANLCETRKSRDFHFLIRVIRKPQRISVRLLRHN